jgi:hypothetical protein
MDLVSKLTQGTFEVSNFNDLKKELTDTLEKYKNLVVKEEDISEASDIKAKLNKTSKAFNDERIRLEKEYMQNFNTGKNQVKELIELISEVSTNIDTQLKTFESKREEEKREAIKKTWLEFDFNLVSLDQIFNDKWLNKGYDFKKINKEIVDKIESIIDDLKIIDNTTEDLIKRKSIKGEYLRTLNLSEAITLVSDKNVLNTQLNAFESVSNVEEELYEITLTLIGTKNALKTLKNYMLDLNIKFEERKEE